MEWYFIPLKGHRGKRLNAALWQYGFGLKVYSERMSTGVGVVRRPAADLASRRPIPGSPAEGYLAVLEDVEAPSPVHSMWRGRRTGQVAINEEARHALPEAGMTGLEIEGAASAFPGDHGFYSSRSN